MAGVAPHRVLPDSGRAPERHPLPAAVGWAAAAASRFHFQDAPALPWSALGWVTGTRPSCVPFPVFSRSVNGTSLCPAVLETWVTSAMPCFSGFICSAVFIQYVLCVRCFLGLRVCKDQNHRGPLVSFGPQTLRTRLPSASHTGLVSRAPLTPVCFRSASCSFCWSQPSSLTWVAEGVCWWSQSLLRFPVSCSLSQESCIPRSLRPFGGSRLLASPALGSAPSAAWLVSHSLTRVISRLRFPSLAVSVLGLPTFQVSGPLSSPPPRGGSPVRASVLPLVSYSLPVLGRLSYRLIASYWTGCFPFTRL